MKSIKDIMTELCKYEGRNHLVKGSLENARSIILEAFEATEAQIITHDFYVDGIPRQNITASFGVQNDETIVVVAHYDTVCGSPGADDNASSVAVMLKLAEYLNDRNDLPYRIDLVCLDTEEPPYFRNPLAMGSIQNAELYEALNINVMLVVVMDMIGYYTDEPVSNETYFFDLTELTAQVKGIQDSNFLVGAYLSEEQVGHEFIQKLVQAIDFQVVPIKMTFNLAPFEMSDCYSYMDCQFPVVLLTDTGFIRNPHYHRASDTIDTIDFDKLESIATGLTLALTKPFHES